MNIYRTKAEIILDRELPKRRVRWRIVKRWYTGESSGYGYFRFEIEEKKFWFCWFFWFYRGYERSLEDAKQTLICLQENQEKVKQRKLEDGKVVYTE